MTLCLVALALLCWPSPPALFRPEAAAVPATVVTLGRLTAAVRFGVGRGGWAGVLAVCALAVPAGVAAAGATLMISATVVRLTSSELRRRGQSKQLDRLLVATRTLAREVRTGASPVTAVLATAVTHPACADALNQLAAAVVGHRGGAGTFAGAWAGPDDSTALRPDQQAEVITRLANGWQLSARYGVPWAALIDTVAFDLAERQRAAALRDSQVAGPRVSGYVLAVMPVLGILLGAGMGADPVHVLLHTGVGSVLLLVGSTLTCLGLAWTAAIVRP